MQMAELLIAIDDRLNSDETKPLDRTINDLLKSFNKLLTSSSAVLKTVLSTEKVAGNNSEVSCGQAKFYAPGEVNIITSLKSYSAVQENILYFRIYKNGELFDYFTFTTTSYSSYSRKVKVDFGDVLEFKIANTYTGSYSSYYAYCQSVTVCGTIKYLTDYDVVE